MMDYNENRILTTYIWNHYTHLMTDFERQVGSAISARKKAQNSSNPRQAAMLY